MRVALVAVLAALLFVPLSAGAFSASASAQASPEAAAPETPAAATGGTTAAQPADADADPDRPQASEYLVLIQNAIRRAKNRDFDAAMEQLRDAFRLEPSNAIAFYYAAEIDRLQHNLPQALERFRTCQGFAEQTSDDAYQARCMQGMAETLERTEGQLEQARLAWAAYVEFADAHRQVSNPEVGRARLNAIDAQMEQDGAYAAVRERIAAREQENAASREQSQRNQPAERNDRRPRGR